MPKLKGFGFADYELQNRFKEETLYDKVDKIIDWSKIDKILKRYYKRNKDALGNPAYPPLQMFKILLVQRWENLSDPQMEFALKDRLSVIKFVGFSITDSVPDHSTINRFRNELCRLRVYDKLLEELNNQLSSKGFKISGRKEKVIDVTVVKSSRRPRKVIKGEVVSDRKEGEEQSAVSDSNNKVEYSDDIEAGWLKKGNKYYYGHKASVIVDAEGYFEGGLTFPANESDVGKLQETIEKVKLGEGIELYGDKGFSSKSNREYLLGRGIIDKIMHKKPKGRELHWILKLWNKGISGVRFVVEQTFGLFKKHLGFSRFRYVGRDKNEMELYLVGIVHNLKKASKMLS
jgi:IS5 family transposase